jgi:lysozyme family protein
VDKIFEEAFEKVLDIEGGYSDHEDDPGGKTKYGITEAVARRNGYKGDMRDLTPDEAKEIYYHEFWLNHNYNKIKNRDIAIEMFDQAVNMGQSTANRNLQKSNNLLTAAKDIYPITVDGVIGPQTLRAINHCSKPIALFNVLNGYQIKHYINLAENSNKYKSFIAGWANNRIEIIRK